MNMMLLELFLFSLLCAAGLAENNTTDNEVQIEDDQETNNHVESSQSNFLGNRTLKEVFDSAVEAYLEEDWKRCIEDFDLALHGYRTYKRMVTNCRKKCRADAEGAEPLFPENIEDLHFYEKKVRETLCLLTCNQDYREVAGSQVLRRLPNDIEQKFIDHRPYEYLHICYFKSYRYQDAANALFTFLALHPDHQASIESLKHYLTLPDVSEENIVNLESAPYVTLYFKGVEAYENGQFRDAVAFFESSLTSYMESESSCRIYCEGPFDQGWLPEFTSSIANHFAFCLKCKRACSQLVKRINGDFRNDILRSHYDYLQFSYYKLGKLNLACSAVESFLLFEPADETMLHNKAYYRSQPMVEEAWFKPRQEAVSYLKRDVYEKKLLRFIGEEFRAVEKRLEVYHKNEIEESEQELANKESMLEKISRLHLYEMEGHSPSSSNQSFNDVSYVWEEDEAREKSRDKERPQVKIDGRLIAEEKELAGKYRYAADAFLNETECQSLMQLANITTVEGDGYHENKSPHTPYEKFEGVTVGRIALMVYFGQINPKTLELLLERTDAVRDHVERYFKLDRHLYFTYTHLVCRTAVPDSPARRDDLSHEIHADNCILTEHNCSRESPAYVWRDYSSILYLNNNFDGGEFFFAKDATSREVAVAISPQCGRMVGFSAGRENLHGVKAVRKGKRCALALWFTLDGRYQEYERILARIILKRVRLIGPVDQKHFFVPNKYEEILIKRFREDKVLRYLLSNSF